MTPAKLLGLCFLVMLGVASCQAGPSWTGQDAIDVVQQELIKATERACTLRAGTTSCSRARKDSILAGFLLNQFGYVGVFRLIENGVWTATYEPESFRWLVQGETSYGGLPDRHKFHAYEKTGIVKVAGGVR